MALDRSVITADPLGSPDYVGFKVIDREIQVLMRNANAEGDLNDAVPARPLLWDIVKGAAGVVNQFLGEADLGRIDIEPSSKRPA